MIYCEEKIKGIVPEGTPTMCRGKVCWVTKDDVKKDAPEFLSLFETKLDESKLTPLKEALKAKLTKKGFVFYEDSYYRYFLRTDKLYKFGINYFEIK